MEIEQIEQIKRDENDYKTRLEEDSKRYERYRARITARRCVYVPRFSTFAHFFRTLKFR